MDQWLSTRERLDAVVTEAAEHLREKWADLDLSSIDLDYSDVQAGLLARQFQIWSVLLLGYSSWTEAAYPLLMRALTDAVITISWIEQNPDSASRYKLYSAGRLKLLAAHWREAGSPDAESLQRRYADHLEELVSTEQWAATVPVELSNWNGRDIRTMANDVGLKQMYDLAYSPLSAEAHGEWMCLRSGYLRLCDEELHSRHWLPLFERPPMNVKVPILATNALLASVEAGLRSLGLEFSADFWEAVEGEVDDCVSELVSAARET